MLLLAGAHCRIHAEFQGTLVHKIIRRRWVCQRHQNEQIEDPNAYAQTDARL